MAFVDLKLRVDIYVDEDLERIKKFIPGVASAYLVVEEDHDGNRHIHAYLRFSGAIKSFRNKFLYAFKDHRGNKAYSVNEMWSGEENHIGYFRYMCKGVDRDTRPIVVISSGIQFTPTDLERYHQEYYDHADDYQKKRKRKADELSIEDELVKRCKDKQLRPTINKLAVIRQCIHLYKERKKGFTDYEIERKVNYACLMLDDTEEFEAEAAERICRKMDR